MKAKISALILFCALPARATFTLTLSTAGPTTPAAIVTSTPSGIVCPGACSASFAAGSTVTLGEYSPSTVAFAGWQGAQGCRTNLQSCNVVMNANAAVTAQFDPLLGLAFSGTGLGFVTVPGSTATPVASSATFNSGAVRNFVFPVGTSLVLNETTGTASSFTGWNGDAGCTTFSTCTITLNGSEIITATFTANGVGPYPLAVTVPMGGGQVWSAPAGIQTSSGVFVATFTALANVTLSTLAAAGYRFGGWANGGCAGLATCVVTSSSPLQGLGGFFSPAAYFFKQ